MTEQHAIHLRLGENEIIAYCWHTPAEPADGDYPGAPDSFEIERVEFAVPGPNEDIDITETLVELGCLDRVADLAWAEFQKGR
jgi:hypothetical protein